MRKLGLFISIVVVVTSLAFIFLKVKPIEPDQKINATLVNSNKKIPSFNLIATTGAQFSENNLKGHWNLLFFGYSKCPKICPARLNTAKKIWEQLALSGQDKKLRFIFVSLQPSTDEVTRLRKFLFNYNHNFIGLTGKINEIRTLSDSLGIHMQKASNSNDGNVIDHTSTFLLLSPDNKLKATFSSYLTVKEVVDDLSKIIN